MSKQDPLLIEMGLTLNRLNRELAKAESRVVKTANQMESKWQKANEKGAQSFRKIDQAAARTGTNIGNLGRIILGAFSVREVQRFADAWTVAGNKIAAASQVAGTQARSLSELNDIATETRSGIEETVDLYAKLLRATKGVAKSEEEVARATAIVNKAFKAGGAAASEQAAGILQLAQGLSSGVLQGDELRSIRENAPLVAQAIADEFKTTIGGLKELGSQGELTAARVFKGILAAQEPIEAAFSKTNSTIGESFTILRNSITEYVGDADKASGASAKIAASINALAENIDALVLAGGILAGRFIGPVLLGMLVRVLPILKGAALAVAGIGSAAGASAVGLASLRGAMALLGGPFGIVIAGLSALPLLMESSAEKTARFEAASDNAKDALIGYAEASKRAADEQGGLEGKISATTRALVDQTREAVQTSLRELEKLRDESIDDLLGNGALNNSELKPAQARIKLKLTLDERSGDSNRFLKSINDELAKIERGAGNFGKLKKEMDALAGVGKEVNTVLRIFDKYLEGTASEMRDAGVPLVDLAKTLGLFPGLIGKVEAAQSDADIKSAYIELREAMIEAMEASETLREGAVADARALIDEAAEAIKKIEALEGSLIDVSKVDIENPFGELTAGAEDAARAVEALTEKSIAAYKEYGQSRAGGASGGFASGMGAAKSLIREREGFRNEPYYDVNAYRAGYGSDTFTRRDGSVGEVQKGNSVSLEDAERDLERRIDSYFNTIIAKIGKNKFDSLTSEQKGALASLLHNYGEGEFRSGGDLAGVLAALQNGPLQNVGAQIARRGEDNQGVNRDRRRDEASAFGNVSGVSKSIDATRAQNDELQRQQELRDGLLGKAQESLAAQEMEIGLIGRNIAEQVRLRTETDLLNEAKRLGIDVDKELTASGKTYRQEIEELARATGELAAQEKVRLDDLRETETAQGNLNNMASNLKNTFLDVATGITSAADAAKNLAQQIARAAFEAAFFGTGPLAGLFGGTKGTGLLSGLAGGLGGLFGFSEGGYTGNGGKSEAKGVVHGGEYVFSKAAVQKIGVPKLEAMHRSLKGFSGGGYVGSGGGVAAPASVNVTSVNVLDPSIVGNYLDTHEGETKFVNILSKHGIIPNG